jgi:hypothetical protein
MRDAHEGWITGERRRRAERSGEKDRSEREAHSSIDARRRLERKGEESPQRFVIAPTFGDTPAVEEVLSRLIVAGFETARLAGRQIHLTAYGKALVVDQTRYGFAVRSEWDDKTTRLCADVDEVVAVVKTWRA